MNPVTAKDVRKVIRLSDEGYSDTFGSKPFEVDANKQAVHAWFQTKFGSDFDGSAGTFGEEVGSLDQALYDKVGDKPAKLDKLWVEVFNLTEELNAAFWMDMAEYQKIRDERKAKSKLPPPDLSNEPSLMDVLNGPGITLDELNDWQAGKD
jgi:hypothetical protein